MKSSPTRSQTHPEGGVALLCGRNRTDPIVKTPNPCPWISCYRPSRSSPQNQNTLLSAMSRYIETVFRWHWKRMSSCLLKLPVMFLLPLGHVGFIEIPSHVVPSLNSECSCFPADILCVQHATNMQHTCHMCHMTPWNGCMLQTSSGYALLQMSQTCLGCHSWGKPSPLQLTSMSDKLGSHCESQEAHVET